MHTLDAQTLLPREEFHLGKIPLFLFRRFPDGPVKDRLGHKLRQADKGDPPKVRLAGIVHPVDALLPPKTLQGRHHILEITLRRVPFAHLDGVGHRVEQLQSLLVGAVLLVGIALPAHRQKVHGGHRDDARGSGGLVEFLILFLVVKDHGHFLRFFGCS